MTEMQKMRVLLADDHPGLFPVIRSLPESDVDVVGCVDNGEALFDAAMKLDPDVIVTDISMPKLNGIDAVNRLRESHCSAKVVFLTVHDDLDFVHAALAAGALGYVLKSSLTTDLLAAIREAFANRAFVSTEASGE
jgi:DNA-binding NarL/FixJ family response regulator